MQSHPDPSAVTTVTLRSGTLSVAVDRADLPLHELCGFASRRSRKRGFVFVSKVLGKHYPVRPRVMHDTYQRLAHKILAGDQPALPGPILLIALAETATGLGQGVYEALWQRCGRADLLFAQSTRYVLNRPLALHFDESHSHATEHLLYEPIDPDQRDLFHQAATLILVDDEITTGNTLTALALAYQREHPRLQQVHFVCLTDWLGAARSREIATRLAAPVFIHSLLQGTFAFQENPAFDPGPIPSVVGNRQPKDVYVRAHSGRTGQRGLIELPAAVQEQARGIAAGARVLVLGTGEFAYPPYRLARWLEEQGHDVHFQSTTRSPLLVERELASVLEFRDNYEDDIPNFVYNVAGRDYDCILIGFETPQRPLAQRVADVLGARALFFSEPEPRAEQAKVEPRTK